MQKHGNRQQFEVCRAPSFRDATVEVTGPCRAHPAHITLRVDSRKVTTGGGDLVLRALGCSLVRGRQLAGQRAQAQPGGSTRARTARDTSPRGTPPSPKAAGPGPQRDLRHLPRSGGGQILSQGGQLPKPVVLMPWHQAAAGRAAGAAPFSLLLVVGTIAVLGIPGELTTMARSPPAHERPQRLVRHGRKAPRAGYLRQRSTAHYITTREEYSAQYYEGASTLFGPHTLEAYQRVAAQLATAIAKGKPSPPGPAATEWTSPPQRRYRFRNLSSSPVRLRFYNKHNWLRWVPLPRAYKTIEAGVEKAYPEREFTWRLLPKLEMVTVKLPTVETVTVKPGNGIKRTISAGQLMVISAAGSISVGKYTPPPRS